MENILALAMQLLDPDSRCTAFLHVDSFGRSEVLACTLVVYHPAGMVTGLLAVAIEGRAGPHVGDHWRRCLEADFQADRTICSQT